MREQEKKEERRRFRRFALRGGPFLVVCCDSGKIIGELRDISSGGMAFLTEPDEMTMLEYFKVDILQIYDGFCLSGIPVRHVSKTDGYFEINRQRMKMTRGSLDFQTLGAEQKKELGTFIRSHTRA